MGVKQRITCFSLAVIKHHGQVILWKTVFIWAYESNGVEAMMVGQHGSQWQAEQQKRKAEGSDLET